MEDYGNPSIYVNKKYLNVKYDNNFRVSLSNADNHYLVFDIYSTIKPKHPETHLGWASFNIAEDSCFDLYFDFQNLIKNNGQLKLIKKWINININNELLYPAFLHIFLVQNETDSVICEKKILIFYDSTLLSHKICQLNSYTIFNPDTRFNIDNFGGFNKFLFVCDENSERLNYLQFRIAYSFLLLNYRNCDILFKDHNIKKNSNLNSNSVYVYDNNLSKCESVIDIVTLNGDNERTFEKILKLLFFNLHIDQNFLHSLQYFNVSDIFVFDNIYSYHKFIAKNKKILYCMQNKNLLFVNLSNVDLNQHLRLVNNNVMIINYININQLFTLHVNINYNIHCFGAVANILLN